MKKTLLFLTTILILSCNQNSNENQSENIETETKNVENFDWLIGKWKRLNNEVGKETFENWEKISPKEYSGIGFTIQKEDTVSQETMNIIENDGKWILFVKMPNEKEPTKFKNAQLKNNEFIFVNDSIDFPKKIKYWIDGEKIKATVSNEEMEIPFEFEKVK